MPTKKDKSVDPAVCSVNAEGEIDRMLKAGGCSFAAQGQIITIIRAMYEGWYAGCEFAREQIRDML